MREVTLDEMKTIMLDMLVYYADFCDKHGLRYYLTGGTLLGAVRHHGYIPWDDDIDVGMPRKDYEKFRELYATEPHDPNYVYTDYHNDPTMYVSTGKMYDARTIMEEASSTGARIGVYLDIFPLDNIGDTEEEAKQFTEEALKYRKYLTVRTWKVNVPGRVWYKNCAVAMIKLFSTHRPVIDLIKEQDKFCSSRQGHGLNGYVGFVCPAMKQEILKGEWFASTRKMPFEGHDLTIPLNYKEVLTVFYGPDYMELPPIEKRVTHHSYKVWYKD